MKSPVFGLNSNLGSATVTQYIYPMGHASSFNATVDSRDVPISVDTTFSKLYVYQTNAPGSGKSRTYALYKNGVATGLTTTISGTNLSNSDLVNTASFSAGDTLTLGCVPTNTPALTGGLKWSMVADTTSGQSLLASQTNAGTVSVHYTFPGILNGVVADAGFGMIMPISGTFSKLYIKNSVAPGAGTSRTYTLVVNGVATSLTTTVADTNLTNSDTSNTVSVNMGDRVTLRNVTSGAVVSATSAFSLLFTPSIDGKSVLGFSSGNNPSTSATLYNAILSNSAFNASAANLDSPLGAWVLKRIAFRTETASGSGSNYTVLVQNNTVDSALAVTSTNTTVSQFMNTDVSIAVGDSTLLKFIPSNTPALTLVGVGVLLQEVGATISDDLIIQDANHTQTVNNATLRLLEYSYKSLVALPTDESSLANKFNATNYTEVSADDNSYMNSLSYDSYNVLVFTNYYPNNTDPIVVTWKGKTDFSPATSPVIMQIFNYNSHAWESADSDSSTAVNTEFDLVASIPSSPANYYGVDNVVTVRIYQEHV